MDLVMVSEGHEFVRDARDQERLEQLLDEFDGCGRNVLCSMAGTRQYYIRKRNRVVAILSFKDHGTSRNETRKMTNVIYNVCTDPRWRGRGLMTAILQRVIVDCCRRGKKRMHLEVLKTNVPAINLYLKLGFRYVRDAGFDGDSIIMRRTLSDACPWRGAHKGDDESPRSVSEKGCARRNYDPVAN